MSTVPTMKVTNLAGAVMIINKADFNNLIHVDENASKAELALHYDQLVNHFTDLELTPVELQKDTVAELRKAIKEMQANKALLPNG